MTDMTDIRCVLGAPGGLGLDPVTVRVAQEVLDLAPINVALRPTVLDGWHRLKIGWKIGG